MSLETGQKIFSIHSEIISFIDWSVNYFEGQARYLTYSNYPAFERSQEGMITISSPKIDNTTLNINASYFDGTKWNRRMLIRIVMRENENPDELHINCLYPMNPSFEDFISRYKIMAIKSFNKMTNIQKENSKNSRIDQFDIALSFSGKQRPFVEKVNDCLKAKGIRTFYDLDYGIEIWGKDLSQFLNEIYSSKSKLVVIFVSDDYINGSWTNHERQSAISKMITQKNEYILPILFDDKTLPGVPATIGYLKIGDDTPEEICQKITQKYMLILNQEDYSSN